MLVVGDLGLERVQVDVEGPAVHRLVLLQLVQNQLIAAHLGLIRTRWHRESLRRQQPEDQRHTEDCPDGTT
ncbi:hypothetical protein [Streptomyces sp. NRRL F-5630]|uniref:hypothetical protein n=1 Tax=Streptomyces sp. NRRL F-5630 TaxID=1463864 RepID=UPI003EBEF5EB